MSPAELLRAYVERHNEGVRAGEFRRLAGLLADYAWRRDPERPAGRLRITVARGRISAIDVTADRA